MDCVIAEEFSIRKITTGLLMAIFLISGNCFGVTLTDKEKGVRDAKRHISERYLGIVFASENKRFLISQMEYIHKAYDQQGLTVNAFNTNRGARRTALINLVMSGFDDYWNNNGYHLGGQPHLLADHLYVRVIAEAQEATWLYNRNDRVFDAFNAKDREESLRELVVKAVDHSFAHYPDEPSTHKQLADQIAYILTELHEIFWKPRAMRNVNRRFHSEKEGSGHEPPFSHYRQYFIDTFTKNPDKTLWYTFKPDTTNKAAKDHKSIQKVLAGYFPRVAASHEKPVKRPVKKPDKITASRTRLNPVDKKSSENDQYHNLKVAAVVFGGLPLLSSLLLCLDVYLKGLPASVGSKESAARDGANEDEYPPKGKMPSPEFPDLRKRNVKGPQLLFPVKPGGGSVPTSVMPVSRSTAEFELNRRLQEAEKRARQQREEEEWQRLEREEEERQRLEREEEERQRLECEEADSLYYIQNMPDSDSDCDAW
ncbi:hypothetical protein [Endozoicomonas euniceicola]|uniref:Uncharacterized protein n=1 Tax=Endozoicomonas euniceicola TaxID=1234143 RepID=A0ABY6GV67_9GAMM|nr:hypothetical protein [Endozoicomonas euniceicola]UYM16649.1 hypothetical protein NX720_01580 [Endozoicomonas euniceicola]